MRLQVPTPLPWDMVQLCLWGTSWICQHWLIVPDQCPGTFYWVGVTVWMAAIDFPFLILLLCVWSCPDKQSRFKKIVSTINLAYNNIRLVNSATSTFMVYAYISVKSTMKWYVRYDMCKWVIATTTTVTKLANGTNIQQKQSPYTMLRWLISSTILEAFLASSQ